MIHLLLAEDEYIEREAMKHIIAQRFPGKFVIGEATNGLEAIDYATSQKPDIIFLDIKMPGATGIKAAKEIRKCLPQVHMVFITAYDYFDYAKEAIGVKAEAFLLKPVDVEEVYAYLEEVIKEITNEKEDLTQTEKVQEEFTTIRKRLEHELKDILLNVHATEESIKRYVQIMDVHIHAAQVALIDFRSIEQYEKLDALQKAFLKERLLKKIAYQADRYPMMTSIGELKDIVPIVFILEEEQENTLMQDIDRMVASCVESIDPSISYQLSEKVDRLEEIPKLLYMEKQRLFSKQYKEKQYYPYGLEDEVIGCIKKRTLVEAEEQLGVLLDTLENLYAYTELEKEMQGFYLLVERGLQRMGEDFIMPNAGELIKEVSSYQEVRYFYEQLLAYAKEVEEKRPHKNQVIIDDFCKYLQTHYAENISLEEAASKVGFSPFYFAKLMKAYTGMSYIDYISKLRIEAAKHLLEASTRSVREVGILVGYENANYFTRIFKRLEGCAPTQYKEKFRN